VAQPADDLRQLMKDLQASLQQATDKLDLTQRQIASEQGERKLLSEQVAALSARVSALSASNASVATAAGPVLPKKKPIAPIAPPPR
jgi:chromosome segregation ATPase